MLTAGLGMSGFSELTNELLTVLLQRCQCVWQAPDMCIGNCEFVCMPDLAWRHPRSDQPLFCGRTRVVLRDCAA